MLLYDPFRMAWLVDTKTATELINSTYKLILGEEKSPIQTI